MRKITAVILIFLLLPACGTKEKKRKPDEKQVEQHSFSTGQLELKKLPGQVIDTFTYWKQLSRYFHFKDEISEEELKDKLELVSNSLNKIKQQPFPPQWNLPSVKSRLLLLENETRQLKWVLDNNYRIPSPDSLFVRWIYAYKNLQEHLAYLSEQKENFEEVFKAKQRRDSLLLQKFNKSTDTVP